MAEKSISAAAQQALAEKYGKNKLVWKDNVENFILLKSNEEYFTDPICKNGYFRGIETYNFVRDIHKIFTPKTIIENYTLWERVIAILFVKKSYKALLRFIALVIDTLDKTSYAIEGVDDDTGFVTNALREALQEHLISSIARPMALHDGETFEEWKLEDARTDERTFDKSTESFERLF